MLAELKSQLQILLDKALQEAFPKISLPPVELDIPSDKKFGEYACNIALRSSKILKNPPLDLAAQFVDIFKKAVAGSSFKEDIDRIEVVKPGFINFYLKSKAILEILSQVFKQKDRYGQVDIGQNEKIQIEFVSANPTGPLSVAHARQAAVGDALANILNFIGFDVTKEFYVNDEGNQINLLGESIRCRAKEILGQKGELPEGGYQGEYIKDIAQEFLTAQKIDSIEKIEKTPFEDWMAFGVDRLLRIIKEDLKDFGVVFDYWAHQSKIATVTQIEKILKSFSQKGLTKEEEGALWFISTQLGDDKDRVLRKSDGTFTYLAPDIVYHRDKFERGFDKVINIWGPDHHGYIRRIEAAVQALGKKKEAIEVLIVQLATIYREGKPISMSTRRGQYISLQEVIEEVGVDAARFFFMMRHINVHLDFDLELAKKETPENPVYYIQYAHARIHSINRKAKEVGLPLKQKDFSLLTEAEEIELVKKLGIFPDVLTFCLDKLDPYPLVSYLQDLATAFHKFYDCHRVIDEEEDLSSERLGLVNATRIVLANGLRLLGLSTPEKM